MGNSIISDSKCRPWHDVQVIARACAVIHANQEKEDLGLPKGKAAWADITRTKFWIARPELILIDLT